MIKFYSTGCPQCKALAIKMDRKKIEYELCTDEDIMSKIGLKFAPALEINGELYNFANAIKWVNEQ